MSKSHTNKTNENFEIINSIKNHPKGDHIFFVPDYSYRKKIFCNAISTFNEDLNEKEFFFVLCKDRETIKEIGNGLYGNTYDEDGNMIFNYLEIDENYDVRFKEKPYKSVFIGTPSSIEFFFKSNMELLGNKFKVNKLFVFDIDEFKPDGFESMFKYISNFKLQVVCSCGKNKNEEFFNDYFFLQGGLTRIDYNNNKSFLYCDLKKEKDEKPIREERGVEEWEDVEVEEKPIRKERNFQNCKNFFQMINNDSDRYKTLLALCRRVINVGGLIVFIPSDNIDEVKKFFSCNNLGFMELNNKTESMNFYNRTVFISKLEKASYLKKSFDILQPNFVVFSNACKLRTDFINVSSLYSKIGKKNINSTVSICTKSEIEKMKDFSRVTFETDYFSKNIIKTLRKEILSS